MLRNLTDLRDLSLRAIDGEIGAIKDSYFDDRHWGLRYLVVDTTRWWPGGEVLISPFSVRGIDWDRQLLNLSITRDQVKDSPSIDFDKPVWMQQEAAFLDYFNYPHYRGGPMLWGISASPAIPPPAVLEKQHLRTHSEEDSDPHLRSAKQVTGYRIEADDGMIGHVEDFLLDDESWALRYFIADTRNLLPGRHVLLATDWIHAVSWDKRAIRVSLTQEAIRNSPKWQDQAMRDENEEKPLHGHYGKTPGGGVPDGRSR